MKQDIAKEKNCPYCKRHCNLNNPHCSKGKALAKKLKSNEKVKVKENTKSLKPNQVLIQNRKNDEQKSNALNTNKLDKEEILEQLFYQCYKNMSLPKKKYIILSQFAKKENMTNQELKNAIHLPKDKLNKVLHKMMKKGYIVREKKEMKEKIFCLTKQGRVTWNAYKQKNKYKSLPFSSLKQEEKEYLEKILIKLSTVK